MILSGLDLYNADNHEGGMAAMLTNGGGLGTETDNRSIDQVVSSHNAGNTRFPSLDLGVQTERLGRFVTNKDVLCWTRVVCDAR